MTDNRTTELRKLLDERGVEYRTHYLHTSWCVGPKLYLAVDNLDGTLTVGNLTPEQAIAATLGNGTCEIVLGEDDYGCDAMVCSKCFKKIDDACSPNYCPNCGAKVVKR